MRDQLNESLVLSRNTTTSLDKHNLKFFKKPDIQVARPSKTFIFLDQALLYVGDNSVFSKRILGFFCFFWIFYTFLYMGMPLLLEGDRIIFCPSGDDGSYVMCPEAEACANYPVEELFIQPATSIIGEFQLVCDRKKLIPFINAAIYLSIFFAAPFFTFMSNKIGRKKTILVACCVSAVSMIFAGIFTNFSLWLTFIFLAGGGFAGLEIVGRVYLSEISGSNFRINSMAFLNLVWAGSQVLLVLIKTVISYWRYIFVYFMGATFLAASLIAHFFFLEESPKYLIHKHRVEVT
jgi:MFS family permease